MINYTCALASCQELKAKSPQKNFKLRTSVIYNSLFDCDNNSGLSAESNYIIALFMFRLVLISWWDIRRKQMVNYLCKCK